MGVLSFRNFIQSGQRQPCDWSQQEIADFYRAYHLLQRNGVTIGIDRGLTDKGEPWLVFFDAASQDVFLHMARIDGRCILVSEALGINFKARSIPELIGQLEETVCRLVSERTDRGRNVVIHPAARIIMAVSAIFLLFKFDNTSTAYAKSEGSSSLDAALRKQEAGIQARLQAALGRLTEAIDTPTAIAAAAGVILTSELLKLGGDQSGRDVTSHEATGLSQSLTLNHVDSDGMIALEDQAGVLVGIHEAIEAETLETASGDASILAELAGITADLLKTFEGAVVHKAGAAELIVTEVAAASTVESGLRFAPVTQIANADLAASASSDVTGQDLSSSPKGNKFEAPSAYSGGESAESRKGADSEPVVVPMSEPADPWTGGDIAISDLHALSSQVGFYKQSSVSGVEASEILKYFYARFDKFELETYNGNAMVEQIGTSHLDVEDIGIWQNVMSNGLVLSVVGSASLIAEIDSWF